MNRCAEDGCRKRPEFIVILSTGGEKCCLEHMRGWLSSEPVPVIDLESWEEEQRQVAEAV